MPPAGFELIIPASERPQADAVDRAATGIGERLNTSSYLQYRVSFPGVKWPRRDVDHSPPTRAEVRNEWSSTSTPPVHLNGVDRESFIYTVYSLPCSELSLQRKKERNGLCKSLCSLRMPFLVCFCFCFPSSALSTVGRWSRYGQCHKQILYINDKPLHLPKCACTQLQKKANI